MKFTSEENQNIIITAIEGGSNYWFADHRVKIDCYDQQGLPTALVIDGKMIDDFSSAAELLMKLDGFKAIKSDVAAERDACDAAAADVLLQLASFGDVLYS